MAAFERTRTIGSAELDMNAMTKQERKSFAAVTYGSLESFYKDPANRAKFEEWRAKRHAATT